jgi:hypothetical protein
MYKYLPSKKFSLILLSIIIALGIIGLFIFFQKTKNNNSLTITNEKTEAKMQEFIVLDSDNDGLKDWEEALWKTDPKKIDSDNDGTTDGDEVKLNRNPLVKNTAKEGQVPSDQADMEIIAANKKADEEFAKLSETDKLSRTFFSQYLASKSAGGADLSETNKQIILDTAIDMTETTSIKKYYSSDIKITNDFSTTSIKNYGNNLGQAFFTGTAVEKVYNEMETLMKASDTNDEKVLADLDPIIESYNNTIAKMLLISVPQEIVYTHLNLLNDLLSLKTSLEEMKKLFSDPVLAIGGIDRYQTAVINLKKDLPAIKNYFINKKISFTNNEYGYILLNII